MSRHYEERYYVKDERDLPDYEHRNRSTSRARSSSRHTSRHRQEDPYYRQRSGSGSSCSSMSDYEGRDRPLVRCPRDVIRAPTPPPVIQRVVERAPTPEADVVERVIVRPQPQQLIERIIERPRTPPPRIIDKEICEPAPPPIVRTRIVKVDHSPKHYYQNQCSRNYMPISSRYDDYDTGSYSTAEAYPQPSYQTAAYPSQAYPSQAYPSQAYPSQPYPSQAHPSQAYPSQAYPSQAHPSQAYPTQAYQGQASGSAYQQPPQQYYSHAGSSPYGYGASNYPQGSSRRY